MPESSPEKTAEAAEVEAPVSQEAPQDGTTAESSAADQGDKGDMLSAVKAAVAPKTEKAPTSDEPDPKPADASPETTPKDGEEEDDEEGDFTEEELALFKRKARKRVEKVIASNKELQAQVAEFAPKAQLADRIMGYVEDQGLSKDEVNQGFDIMGKLKNSPRQAFEALKPIYAQLQQMFGEVLPDDLQQEVSLGRITEARARELAGARTDQRLAQERADRETERSNQRRSEEAVQKLQNDVGTAMSAWEQTKAKTDPDWKLKSARLMDRVKLDVMENGPLKSPEDARQRAEKALTAINEEFKAFAPRRQAVTPTPDVSSTRSVPKPTSMLEAMKQAAAGG